MEKRPKVSVVIPIYNVENYLSRCLESVIHQTLLDIEIIGVNDGTKDNSVAILCKYMELVTGFNWSKRKTAAWLLPEMPDWLWRRERW